MTNDYIQSLKNNIAQLEATYGKGVRPAWVGEEIGTTLMQIEYQERLLSAQYGSLDGAVPNHVDHTKRGFDPK